MSDRNFDFGALRVFLLDFGIAWGLGSPGVGSDRFAVAIQVSRGRIGISFAEEFRWTFAVRPLDTSK